MNTPNRQQTAREQRAAHLKQQLAQHHQQQRQQKSGLPPSPQPPNPQTAGNASNPTNLAKPGGLAPAHLAQHVLSTLIEDKSDLQAMLKLLKDERAVLEQREHRALEQYAKQKIDLAAKLEARHKTRMSLLPHDLANATNKQSWRASIEALEKKSAVTLLPSWEEVEALLRQSRELMQINEKIVGNLQNSVSRFMNVLRGETGSGQTYSAAGKAETYSTRAPIISA